MPRLLAQSAEMSGLTFDLTGPEVTLGRLDDNVICVPHSSVSGHHAVLRTTGEDYAVSDLGSTNGTRINGERVTEQKLRRNDLLRVGNIEFLYDSEFAPPGRPMPQVAERVNLTESFSAGRGHDFANASPVPKAALSTKRTWWSLVYSVLIILVLASVGYFVFEAIWLPANS